MREYLSTTEIAERFGVSRACVENWIRKGVTRNSVRIYLKAQRIGRNYRIHEEDLTEFIRLCNPDTWREEAELQERERREAREAQARMLEVFSPRKRSKGKESA